MKNRILPLAALIMCLALVLSAVSAWAEETAGTPLLTLDQTELTLVKGKSQKLKTTLENVANPKKAKYAWATSDDTVATVDKGGTVKAKDGKVSFRGFKGRYRLSWKDASDNERDTLVEVK